MDDLTDSQSTLENNITIIVPAFNEEKGIASVLGQLTRLLEQTTWIHEVIVVDDGSQDQTNTVVNQFDQVRVIQHKENRGYGAALKTGILHTETDIICIIDADGTYPVESISTMFDRFIDGKYDMVVAARTGDQVAIPILRRPAKWILRQIANFVAGETIPDLNSGLRIFRRNAVLNFFNMLPNGFSFTTTTTLAMLTNGYLVDFQSIDYSKRIGRSKFHPFTDTFNLINLLLRIALYFVPLKIFLPLSGFFIGLAIIWAFVSRYFLGQLADVSTTIIAMTGIQVFMLGLLAELINRRLPNYHRRG